MLAKTLLHSIPKELSDVILRRVIAIFNTILVAINYRVFPEADQQTRASVSIRVVRLTPKLRQAAAFDIPTSRAAMTASNFSLLMAVGRPPTRPCRLAAASPAMTRSRSKALSYCARAPK